MRNIVLAALCTMFASQTTAEAKGLEERACRVSLPRDSLLPKERIVSLELKVEEGIIYSLIRVPGGWYFDVRNDAAGAAMVRGNAQVGSAAISLKDVSGLFVVEPIDPTGRAPGLKLILDATRDFIHVRKVGFSSSGDGKTRLALTCSDVSVEK